MSEFCKHLPEYEQLFGQTETAYGLVCELVQRLLTGDREPGLAQKTLSSMADWDRFNTLLRQGFLELVRQGKVEIPCVTRHRRKRRGPARCTECHQAVPRLEYPDWKVAANGSVSFRGEDLPLCEPAAEPLPC